MLNRFKAWDKDYGCYFEATHRLMIRLDGEVYNSESGETETARFVILPFTGMITDNGTKVFADDIIESSILGGTEKSQYVVKYDAVNCCWYGEPINATQEKHPLSEIRFGAVVIGNINEAESEECVA